MTTFTFEDTAYLGYAALGRMSLGVGNEQLGTQILDAGFIPTGFTLRRGFEGPQIICSWGPPEDLGDTAVFPAGTYEVRLERKTLDFSYRLGEATTVYSGTLSSSHIVADTAPNVLVSKLDGVTPLRSYYYTLYIKDEVSGLFVTDERLRKNEFTYNTGYFPQKMYSLLPEVYLTADLRPDAGGIVGQEKLATIVATNSSSLEGESFNFGEDPTKTYGELRRFLKIVGLEYDRIRGLLEFIPKIRDIDTTDRRWIKFLARNVGLELKTGLRVERQRDDLRQIVFFYKNKGTASALKSRTKAVSGSKCVVVKEYNENTILTNNVTRKTPYVYIPENRPLPASPAKKLTYVVDPRRTQRRNGSIYFFSGDADLGSSLTFADVTKTVASGTYKPYEMLESPGDYTVEFNFEPIEWPNPPAVGAITSATIAIRTYDTSTSPDRTSFVIKLNAVRISTSGALLHRVSIYYDNSGTETFIGSVKEEDGYLSLNKRIHLAFVREITDVSGSPFLAVWKIYIDGVLTFTSSTLNYTVPSQPLANDDGIVLGDSTTLNGAAFKVDEFRVWHVPRTAAQILANMSTPISQPEGLLLVAHGDAEDGSLIFDASPYLNHGTVGGDNPPVIVGGVLDDPGDALRWEVSRHQKAFKNDLGYYTPGSTYGLKAVASWVSQQSIVNNYPEVVVT